jgi:predicted transcriptional regulator
MEYRSRAKIISQILEAANGGGAKKTKLMYKAYLGHTQLKEYLMALTESDLLRYDFVSRTFMTTERGLRFLEIYNQMSNFLKTQNNKNNNVNYNEVP